jgi:hypothetical protein
VNVDNLTPENFRELLSASMFVVAIIFSFLSLSKNWREHSLRMTGLFLLVGLALFAHNAYSYFATLFIVATAVTQPEFLQNLAAIIRGSKEYFEYKKEYLSPKEVETSIEKDVKAIESAPPEITDGQSQKVISLTIDKTNLTPTQFALLVEEYTFKFLEKKYSKPIQKYVRYRGKRYFVEFDGVMQMNSSDLIFEIKSSRRTVFPATFILDSTKRLIGSVREYQELTKRTASLRFVLVGNFPASYIPKLMEKRANILEEVTDIDITFESYTFEEIGLTDLQIEQDLRQTIKDKTPE